MPNGNDAWYLADLLEHYGITWGGWNDLLATWQANRATASQLRRVRPARPGASIRQMKTIFMSVQTGMVVRDLLRCGPLQRVLSHPDARVVLLTPGVRDPAFAEEFAHARVEIVPHVPYEPTPMVWRLMNRRWRHARTPALADPSTASSNA